jgi:hypothetical protein
MKRYPTIKDQRVIYLYDSFTHGDISRRDFIDRVAALTGSTAAAVVADERLCAGRHRPARQCTPGD